MQNNRILPLNRHWLTCFWLTGLANGHGVLRFPSRCGRPWWSLGWLLVGWMGMGGMSDGWWTFAHSLGRQFSTAISAAHFEYFYFSIYYFWLKMSKIWILANLNIPFVHFLLEQLFGFNERRGLVLSLAGRWAAKTSAGMDCRIERANLPLKNI